MFDFVQAIESKLLLSAPNMNDIYCCDKIKQWIEDQDCPIYYDLEDRYFCVSAPRQLLKKYGVWKGYGLTYCPGCGTKVPEHLSEKRMEILEHDYGLDDPLWDEEQKTKIPQEFLTDEWCKKRGL